MSVASYGDRRIPLSQSQPVDTAAFLIHMQTASDRDKLTESELTKDLGRWLFIKPRHAYRFLRARRCKSSLIDDELGSCISLHILRS